jgi:hypothetical protein
MAMEPISFFLSLLVHPLIVEVINIFDASDFPTIPPDIESCILEVVLVVESDTMVLFVEVHPLIVPLVSNLPTIPPEIASFDKDLMRLLFDEHPLIDPDNIDATKDEETV